MSATPGSRERWLPVAGGLLALIPFAAYHGMFARLFWFGDDFDMIDQFDRLGFWRWIWQVYAENFVPLSKVIWGGGVIVFGGSYAAMIALTWLVHAVNTVLLGRLMRTCGIPWMGVFIAQVIFGLTPANLETLAWSVQLMAMLSLTFLLLALESFFSAPFRRVSIAWAAASALSFIRGVLSGLLLAIASLWPGEWGGDSPRSRRVAYAAACLVPTLVIMVLITVLVPGGNHRHMEGHVGEAAVYAGWFYCLNPAYRLLRISAWGPGVTVLLGLMKIGVVGLAIVQSRGRSRLLFVLMLLLDLSYSVLLGIGRYNTGLPQSTSSRYQYASLVANLPALGFVVARLWDRLPIPSLARGLAFSALLAWTGFTMCRLWAGDLEPFSVWRGTDSRRTLSDAPGPGPAEVPGFPGFPMDRARELIREYNLH